MHHQPLYKKVRVKYMTKNMKLQIDVTQEFFQHERKDLALSNPQWMGL
jgi:hypothetical protein